MDAIEERLQIEVDHPPAPLCDVALGLGDGRLTAPPRAETVARRVKGPFEVRLQDRLHRLLHDPVDHVRNAQAPLATPRLRDPHPPDPTRPVGTVQQRGVQRRQLLAQVLTHLRDALPVRSGGALIRRHLLECLLQMPLVRYCLHRHRGWRPSPRDSWLRHRPRTKTRPAWPPCLDDPLRAGGCPTKQPELSHRFAGRGSLPSPPRRDGYGPLSLAGWYYGAIRLLLSLRHLVVGLLDDYRSQAETR